MRWNPLWINPEQTHHGAPRLQAALSGLLTRQEVIIHIMSLKTRCGTRSDTTHTESCHQCVDGEPQHQLVWILKYIEFIHEQSQATLDLVSIIFCLYEGKSVNI